MANEDNDDSTEDIDEGFTDREEIFDDVDTDKIDEDLDEERESDDENRQANVVEQNPQLAALQNIEEITDLVKEFFTQQRENKKVEQDLQTSILSHRRKIVIVTAGTFVLVVGIAAYMTIEDALSGDAFTFVLGTLFGSILTFLQDTLQQNSGQE